jgi:hypothetical protein
MCGNATRSFVVAPHDKDLVGGDICSQSEKCEHRLRCSGNDSQVRRAPGWEPGNEVGSTRFGAIDADEQDALTQKVFDSKGKDHCRSCVERVNM